MRWASPMRSVPLSSSATFLVSWMPSRAASAASARLTFLRRGASESHSTQPSRFLLRHPASCCTSRRNSPTTNSVSVTASVAGRYWAALLIRWP